MKALLSAAGRQVVGLGGSLSAETWAFLTIRRKQGLSQRPVRMLSKGPILCLLLSFDVTWMKDSCGGFPSPLMTWRGAWGWVSFMRSNTQGHCATVLHRVYRDCSSRSDRFILRTPSRWGLFLTKGSGDKSPALCVSKLNAIMQFMSGIYGVWIASKGIFMIWVRLILVSTLKES